MSENTEVMPVLYLVQTSDYCWGKGPTLAEAIVQCRKNGSKVSRTGRKVDYIVYAFDGNVKPDTAFVDNMGSCRWEVNEPDEAAGFRVGLVNQWLWQDGANTSLMPE